MFAYDKRLQQYPARVSETGPGLADPMLGPARGPQGEHGPVHPVVTAAALNGDIERLESPPAGAPTTGAELGTGATQQPKAP